MNIYLYCDGKLEYDDSLRFITSNSFDSIPLERVSNIFLFGKVLLDTNVINVLCKYKINVFLFKNNNYSLVTTPFSNGKILVSMSLAYTKNKIRLSIAKNISKSTWYNMAYLLKNYNIDSSFLKESLHRLNLMNSFEELLLLEAQTRKIYYSYFNEIIRNDDFLFNGRFMQIL